MDEAGKLFEEIKAGKEVCIELGNYILSATFFSNYGGWTVRSPERPDAFRKGNTVASARDLAYGLATLEAH